MFGAVRKGINTAWGVTTPRPFLRERLIDIALVLGAGMLVLIVLFTAPIIEVIRGMVELFAVEGELPGDLVCEIIAKLCIDNNIINVRAKTFNARNII